MARCRRAVVQTDVLVRDEGSVYMVTPLTPAASVWVENHIPDVAQWLGNAFAVERRYIANVVDGMTSDSLVVRRSN